MIPKVIHYCWFGGAGLPERDQRCIESWRRACPGYEIVRWDESNYDVTKNPYMQQAYEAGKWGFVPDYARLDIVLANGGIYLDTDVELLQAPDDLLGYAGYAGISRDGFCNPGLGFAAEMGCVSIRHMMTAYDGLVFRRSDGTLNQTASPHYASASLEELGFSMDGSFQIVDGFALLPSDWLDPLDPATGKIRHTENTHSVHWYFGSWLDPQVKMQKELRRAFNARHVPDAVAFPLSRGVAYVRHRGLVDSVRRVLSGPPVNGRGR